MLNAHFASYEAETRKIGSYNGMQWGKFKLEGTPFLWSASSSSWGRAAHKVKFHLKFMCFHACRISSLNRERICIIYILQKVGLQAFFLSKGHFFSFLSNFEHKILMISILSYPTYEQGSSKKNNRRNKRSSTNGGEKRELVGQCFPVENRQTSKHRASSYVWNKRNQADSTYQKLSKRIFSLPLSNVNQFPISTRG